MCYIYCLRVHLFPLSIGENSAVMESGDGVDGAGDSVQVESVAANEQGEAGMEVENEPESDQGEPAVITHAVLPGIPYPRRA